MNQELVDIMKCGMLRFVMNARLPKCEFGRSAVGYDDYFDVDVKVDSYGGSTTDDGTSVLFCS